MKFELSFPKEFTELYEEYLNDPIKRKLIAIEGITPEYMDIPALSKKYFTENLADVSIDANANANALDNKNPNSYSAELSKGFLKLEGYYLIFRELEKRLGLERAKSLIKSVWDGDLYIHDASGPMIQSYYCYAYSTSRIMTEGRPWGQLHSKKPKRARQFMAQVIETTMDFSQQQAGAVAIADVIINYSYYAKKENLSDKDIENDFQNLIHILNQQFRVSGQSLTYETQIIVNDKRVAIGDFVEENGDNGLLSRKDLFTYSLNTKTGRVEKNRIYGVSTHKRKNPIAEIELYNGQKICVTTDHSLFTMNDNCEIVTCTANDKPTNIIIPRNIDRTETKEIDISEYKKVLNSVTAKTRVYDKIELTDKFLYLLGFYLGDGNCKGSTLSLSVFNPVLEEYFISSFPEFSPRKENGAVCLNIGKQLSEWIKNTFGHGAFNKAIPVEFALLKNANYIAAGLVDSDGYLDAKKRSGCVAVCNRQLVSDLQFLLQVAGLHSTFTKSITNCNNFKGCRQERFKLYLPNRTMQHIPTILKRVEVVEKLNDGVELQLTSFKKKAQNLFKHSNVFNAGWQSNVTRIEKIRELSDKIKECITLSEEAVELKKKATLLGLPAAICNVNRGKKSYGGAVSYNLTTGVNVDSFLLLLEKQKEKAIDLADKIDALQFSVPIKVKSIRILEDRQDEFVYDISVENNENFLTGNGIFAHNSAFVNISLFDKHNLKTLFSEAVYPDFTHPDVEYVMKLQRIFLDFFSKGDPISEQPYRFPVVTCAFINDEKNGYPLDGEFLSYVCERTYQNGCTNIYISDDIGKISSCCRLQSDLKQLKGGDSFGNGGLNVGSGRVVAVNLASIGLQSRTEEEYFSVLDKRLEDSKEILLAHRSLLHKRAAAGFVPFISRGYVNIDRHLFSTIGINAIAEGVMFLTGKELHKDDGAKDLAKRILKRIKDFSYECIDSTGFPFNVEEVPGESLAPKHALKDKIRYEQPLVIYSNQFVSLWADVDLFDRIRLEGEFSKSLTGGGIAHLNIEHVLASPEEMEKLVRFAITSGLEHFAINYAFNVCENDHSFVGGNHEINCPVCGGKVKESLTRVVGYFTPVSAWNSVRREIEFGMRKFYGK